MIRWIIILGFLISCNDDYQFIAEAPVEINIDDMATFESYGAVGDGITDDRDAIYNALNSGLEVTGTKGKVYYIGSSIEITGKDINVIGNNCKIILDFIV